MRSIRLIWSEERLFFWVDFDSSFGTTERYISDCELESHKWCKSHNFLKIDSSIVSCASFDWKFVMLVLSTVTSDVFNLTIVTTNWNGESDDVIAGTDEFKIVLADTSLWGGSVEEKFDLLKETRFFVWCCSGIERTNTYAKWD